MSARTPAELKELFESDTFARDTTCTGPLGPEYTLSGTRLRLWAPTAQSVCVNLYRKGRGGVRIGTLPLERGPQGVWSIYLPGDQHGRYYTFTVTVDGVSRETGDPYARAAGVNGTRSMIVDLARTAPSGWERDVRPVIPPEQRAVWEVSVRDFSQDAASGVRPAWRGKFMAFTQQGTTLHGDGIHPTCLNYLKRLGVKYVQLMPIFDFGSVDEAKPLLRQYNWGYDPTNYNVPEGSYSTDPTRGEVRIRECRKMIAALHAAGIGVVMDVVYNHMYRSENPLNDTVPCYFFRQNEDGSFSNGSGCGNEFASERPMARRYMIDSILYWAQEYHIDGFRFDLMGLYDVETINAVRAALDTLPGGRDILMYGEPWQGGGSQLHRYEANKANLAMLNERIGIFCDDTRDTIKGGCFNAREPGYVEGRPGSFWDIGGAVAAWCRSDRLPPHAPSQIVSYVSAHDNFTLWDKLLLVRYEKPEFTAADNTSLAQNRLAAGIYLTSFGLPFLQAGEEFARTKKGKGNSYRSSPALNRLDWERAEKYHALVDYYRGLLALRARFPRLSSTDPHAPDALHFFSLEQPLVGWQLPAQWGDGAAWQALCVFYNPTETSKAVPLPVGRWQMLSDGISSSLWRGPYPEKCFHPGNSIAQGLYGPDISHIPDIRRQIIEPVPGEAETVFQFSSQCQDSPLFPSIEKRQRGIAAGTAYHIGTATVPVHNRIISPQTDPPVVAENGITHALQFLPCLFLVVAYGSSRCIGTGHDQRFRHLQSVVVGKEEQMKRRIREHNAQKGILRGQ